MLLKLTPRDDLPLTLGAHVPRPEELDKGIVELQKVLGELDEQIAKNRGVRWVPDDRVRGSDTPWWFEDWLSQVAEHARARRRRR